MFLVFIWVVGLHTLLCSVSWETDKKKTNRQKMTLGKRQETEMTHLPAAMFIRFCSFSSFFRKFTWCLVPYFQKNLKKWRRGYLLVFHSYFFTFLLCICIYFTFIFVHFWLSICPIVVSVTVCVVSLGREGAEVTRLLAANGAAWHETQLMQLTPSNDEHANDDDHHKMRTILLW